MPKIYCVCRSWPDDTRRNFKFSAEEPESKNPHSLVVNFYFYFFPDELRIVIDPSLILTILLICSWYLAMVWAMCTSWGQVMMFAFRKSHSEPFSWKAVISHSSDCMFSPRFSTPMYRKMFSWFMWGSLNISCSASQDCLSWKHQSQVQFINAVLLRCTY